MKNNDLFISIDDETIDQLAQDFPILTDEEKERMYAMSERKYNITNDKNADFTAEAEVSGVDVYKRPKWRTASIAASLALLIGAGGFGGYNIAKQFHSGTENDNDVPTTVSEDISQTITAVTTDPREEGYRQTAEELLEEYNDFLEPYNEDELPEDSGYAERTDDMTDEEWEAAVAEFERKEAEVYNQIWFELGSGDPYDHPNYKHIGSWSYNHYETGMKYSSTDEVMEKALSFMSQSCIDKQFPHLIGEDLTNYEPDRIYRQDTEKYPDFGTYAMYGGKLYYNGYYSEYSSFNCTCYFYDRKDEPVEITDITDDSFTATIKYDFTTLPNKYDMTMKVVNVEGKWTIDDIEATGPELDPQKLAVIEKMCNSCDYFDKLNAKSATIEKLTCPDYDSEGKTMIRKNLLCNTGYYDVKACREYSYNGEYQDYSGGMDIEALLAYTEKTNIEKPFKLSEDYCDGEKYYYWQNPSVSGEGEIEYEGWYHWTYYPVPTEKDKEKFDPLSLIRITAERSNLLFYDDCRKMICPNGSRLVTDLLFELKCWDITGDISFEDRDCYVIEGTRIKSKNEDDPDHFVTNPSNFGAHSYKFYVDKETGIPLGAEYYDENGEIYWCEIYYDLKFNDKAEPVPDVDISGYEFTYK